MKARVIHQEIGKEKVVKQFDTIKDAVNYARRQRSNYTIPAIVKRRLSWVVQKKTKTAWTTYRLF